MARSLHPLLLLFLAACLLRFQVSECSASPSSSSSSSSSLAEELRKRGSVPGDALRHEKHDAENRTALLTEAADDDGAAPSASATTPSPDKDGVGSSGARQASGSGREGVRLSSRPASLLLSKRARRFLHAVGVDDAGKDADALGAGAGPSCHSNDVHAKCPPASKP